MNPSHNAKANFFQMKNITCKWKQKILVFIRDKYTGKSLWALKQHVNKFEDINPYWKKGMGMCSFIENILDAYCILGCHSLGIFTYSISSGFSNKLVEVSNPKE